MCPGFSFGSRSVWFCERVRKGLPFEIQLTTPSCCLIRKVDPLECTHLFMAAWHCVLVKNSPKEGAEGAGPIGLEEIDGSNPINSSTDHLLTPLVYESSE